MPGPRAVALVGILAISFSAIFVKLADASPVTAAFYRGAYAVPLLVVIWLATRTPGAGRGRRLRVLAFVSGVFLGIDLNFWHRAIDLVGAGLSTVLANLQVILVALAAWAVHRERPTTAAFVAIPVALAGVALTTGLGRADAYGANPVLGAAFGVAAALAYTVFLLVFRASGRSATTPAGPLLDASLGIAAVSLLLGPVTDAGFTLAWEWPSHGWLLALALGPQALGWLAIAYALPRLPALETSVLLLLQPALTMLWGLVLFTETPSPVQWVGVVLILVGVGVTSVAGAASPPPQG